MRDLDQLREVQGNANCQAFLRLIREKESGQEDKHYRIINGGDYFEAPPWEHPYKALKTTQGGKAAGAYQHIPTTWGNLVRLYGFPDFSPENQDLSALALIDGRKALDDVLEGRIASAIAKCRQEWTSLPGASESSSKWTMEKALALYQSYGGALTAQEEEKMPPVPLLLAGLEFLKGAFPAIAAALASKASVPERNVQIATTLLDTATKVTNSANFQEAIQKIEADPEAKKAVSAALHEVLPTLIEAGGGGIQGARDAAASQSGDWRKLLFSLPFVGIVVFTPAIWAVVAAAVFNAPWLLPMDPQLRGTVIGFVMGTLAGSIVGYIYGSAMSRTSPK